MNVAGYAVFCYKLLNVVVGKGDNMGKFNRGLFLFLCLGVLFLASCGNNEQSEKNTNKQTTKEYDLLIYNSDTSIAESFEKMCSDYTSRTGVIVKAITPEEDENASEKLDSYMNSGEAPDIYTISSMQELKKWQSSGQVLDFSNATETNFKEIANKIPESLRLSSNTVDNFGIPYTINGYGYVVDPKMISSLFGADKYRAVLEDLKACGYDEFEGFINALKIYIESGSLYEFYLNKNSYRFKEKRSGLSENLNGIFAFPAGTASYTGFYMLNPSLAYKFNSAAGANVADSETISSLKNTLSSFARSIDLLTSSVSTKNGGISRGIELVNNVTNSPTQALKSFVNGQALFLIADNSIYDSMFLLDSSLANRATILPIKMPEVIGDTRASNLEEGFYNQSIVISVPRYFAINAKSDEKQQKLAQDFFVWFKTSELAQKYIMQEFKFIPYDLKESSAIDNQLSRKMVEYLSGNQILPAVCNGLPEGMAEDIGKSIIDKYYTVPNWYIDEYELIAQEVISTWKKLKQ